MWENPTFALLSFNYSSSRHKFPSMSTCRSCLHSHVWCCQTNCWIYGAKTVLSIQRPIEFSLIVDARSSRLERNARDEPFSCPGTEMAQKKFLLFLTHMRVICPITVMERTWLSNSARCLEKVYSRERHRCRYKFSVTDGPVRNLEHLNNQIDEKCCYERLAANLFRFFPALKTFFSSILKRSQEIEDAIKRMWFTSAAEHCKPKKKKSIRRLSCCTLFDYRWMEKSSPIRNKKRSNSVIKSEKWKSRKIVFIYFVGFFHEKGEIYCPQWSIQRR